MLCSVPAILSQDINTNSVSSQETDTNCMAPQRPGFNKKIGLITSEARNVCVCVCVCVCMCVRARVVLGLMD